MSSFLDSLRFWLLTESFPGLRSYDNFPGADHELISTSKPRRYRWPWMDRHPAYAYAVEYWAHHAYKADTSNQVINFLQGQKTILMICIALRFPDGCTGLHIAAYFGLAGPLTAILRREGQSSTDFDSADSFGQTPLLWAAANGRKAVVRLLLNTGKVKIHKRDSYGWTSLFYAVEKGHEQIIRLLIDSDADINAQGGLYGNALQVASSRGHEQIVKLLIDSGADINAQGGYYGNALQAASRRGGKRA